MEEQKTILKALCPRCKGERNCQVHGFVNVPWEVGDQVNYHWGRDESKLLQCCGCETVFLHIQSWDSELFEIEYDYAKRDQVQVPVIKTTTFPAPEVEQNQKPDWIWEIAKIDPQLHKILDETYTAYEASSLILAAVGLRTAFDRATEVLKIDPGHTLDEKIKQLQENGFIGETEASTLGVVANAGSAAAHRAWSPDETEFQTLLTALEQFLQRTVVSGKKALSIANNIPPRQPRPKKLGN